MALLFADGLDLYDDQADVVAGGLTKVEGSTHTFGLSGGRYGGGYIGGTGTYPGWGVPCTKGPGDTFYLSFAYYHDGAGSSVGDGDYWIYPRDSAGQQPFQVFHKSDGTITLRDHTNSTVGTPSGTVLSSGTWHWIELKIVMGTNDSNGEISIKVDGTVATSVSSIDTYNFGLSLVNVGLYGSSGSWKADDIILTDTTGSYMTAPPGDARIDTLRPTADGGTVNWTASAGADWQCVDDALGSSDGDSTYIESQTVAQESRFEISDLTTASTTIFAVQTRLKAKNTNAGMRSIRTVVNNSGSETVGNTFTPDTTYTWSRGAFVHVNPATAAAYNDAGINAMQAGVEVVS